MSDLNAGPAGLPPFAAADRTPSRIAGRYDLGEVIGVGAPAWVYRAEDRETGHVVAVKLYPKGFGGPDQDRRQQELGALTGLHHPNLVELLDAGDESGRAYLVMELVEGRTLGQRVLDGTMSAGDVARLGADLGYALAYLHSRGIVHRTVKPANVLLGDRPMLTDFGTAVLVDPASVSLTGSLTGTPSYLAPEQVTGGAVGTAADVYALGLMLLEALTGRREYAGDGLDAAMARLSRRPSVPADIPALSDLLHAMTATDPVVRPAAGVVSEALRAAAPGMDGLSSARLPAPGAQRPERRISSLERLEGLDTVESPGTRRGSGRRYGGDAGDGSELAAPAGGADPEQLPGGSAVRETTAKRERPAPGEAPVKSRSLISRALPVWPAARVAHEASARSPEALVERDEPDGHKVPPAGEHSRTTGSDAPDEGTYDEGAHAEVTADEGIYDGATYDGATYDGATYDGATYDGATYDGGGPEGGGPDGGVPGDGASAVGLSVGAAGGGLSVRAARDSVVEGSRGEYTSEAGAGEAGAHDDGDLEDGDLEDGDLEAGAFKAGARDEPAPDAPAPDEPAPDEPAPEEPDGRGQPVREKSAGRRVGTGVADSGTMLLDVPPAPSGLPLPSSWAPPVKGRRAAGHRRLLAAALGLTALAAATVGVLVSRGPGDEPPPVPVDSGTLDQPPPASSALPVRPVPGVPPVVPVPGPGPARSGPPAGADTGPSGNGGGGGGGKKHKGGGKKKH